MVRQKVIAHCLGTVIGGAAVAGIGHGALAQDKVTVWKFGSPQQERAYFAKENERFTAAPLDVQLFDFDARFQRIAAASSAGNLPDVIVIENSMLPSLVDSKVLLDLGGTQPDLVTSWQGRYVPALWQLGSFDGKFYGFSPYVDLSPMLLYNKEMLQDAGIEPPTTWSEMIKAAAALTKDGKYGVAFGASNNSVDIDTLESLAAVNGMRWVDGDGKPVVDEASLADTLKFVQDLSKSAPPGLTEANFRAALQLFFQRRVAMVIVKSFVPIIQDDYKVAADFPSVLVKFPRPDKVIGPFGSVDFEAQASFLFAATRSGDDAATMAYLDFWADPAHQRGWTGTEVRGRVPAATALLESPEFAQNFPGLAAEYKKGTLFTNVISVPAFPEYPELRRDLTTAIQSVILGAETPEEAATKLVQATKAAVNK